MDYREQHRERLAWMPWLWHTLKPADRAWAEEWQREVQERLQKLETVRFAAGCFVAPDAKIFAEPHRGIEIGEGCTIGAQVFMHGPLKLGRNVSVNPRCALDGGRKGIVIGDDTRIATNVAVYAFDHGIAAEKLVREQAVRSEGIVIGADVWIGANAGITDGVKVGDHAVVGMGAVVTRDVAEWAIVAGSPARVIGDRRQKA
jgi:acetyltransferase-like isoleucine patch superfamily enzyme